MPDRWPNPSGELVGIPEWIESWSSKYSRRDFELDQRLYEPNVRWPLTPDRLRPLLMWKYSSTTRLTGSQEKLLKRLCTILPDLVRSEPASFLEQPCLKRVPLVTAVLLLHCSSPSQHPIFDRHVWRAYQHLSGITPPYRERPTLRRHEQIPAYLDYHRWHANSFAEHTASRDVDRAIFEYGKSLTPRRHRTPCSGGT